MSAAPTDPELTTRATRGDRAAFGELVRRHWRYVFSVVIRMVLETADAEDATQEAFARVFASMPAAVDSFRTYVCVVAKRICIDRRKWMARRRFVDVDEANLATDETPADAFERHETRATVRAAVAELPPTQRHVVSLLIDGATREQLAAALGVDEAAVSRQLTLARNHLVKRGMVTRKPWRVQRAASQPSM